MSERLKQGPLFASVAQIYAAPQEVRPGQQRTASEIAASLRQAGYNINPEMGTFRLQGDTIQVKPGPQSYLAADGATIVTSDGVVKTITAEDGAPLAGYKLEPQLITALSEGSSRTKRRMVTYDQIPPQMVQAVLAIEDRRFFEHGGINYVRTFKCAVQDVLAAPHELRRFDADAAACAWVLPHAGQEDLAQDRRGHDHLPAREPLHEEADLRDVRE